MADLVLSARLKADADGFVGEIRQSKDEVEKLHKTTEKAATSSKKGARDLDDYGRSSRKAASDVRRLNRENKSVSDGFRQLKTAIIGLGLIELTRRFDLLGFKVEAIESALRGAAGSAQAYAESYAFVRSEADRLGLALASSAKDFGQLTASAKGTELAGAGVRDIFTAVSESAVVLKLSADDSSGAIRAITQIMSKGKVQAEELRGQLGERLPGAFQIAARAMGVTTQQLDKMLEQGQVLSVDFLPKFAKELRNTFGENLPNAIKSGRAELNRFTNVIFEASRAFAQGGAQDGFVTLLKEITAYFKDPAVLQSIRGFGSIVGDTFRFAAENGRLITSVLAGLASAKILAGIGSLAVGIRTATTAMIGFTVALAANPLGLLVVGISAAASALTYFKDELVTVSGQSATVWDFVASGADVMGETVTNSINAISDAIDDTFGPGAASVAGDFVIEFLENFALLPKTLINTVYATAKSITDPFFIAFEEIYNAGKRVFDRLDAIMTSFSKSVTLALDGDFQGAYEEALKDFDQTSGAANTNIFDRSRTAITENFETDWLGDLMKDLWQAGADASEDTIDDIAKRAALRYQGRIQQQLDDPLQQSSTTTKPGTGSGVTELSKEAQKAEKFISGLRAQKTALQNLTDARKLGSQAVREANILNAQDDALRRAGIDTTKNLSAADQTRVEIIRDLVRSMYEMTEADEAAQAAADKHKDTVEDINTRLLKLKPAYEQARIAAEKWRQEALAGVNATKQGYQEFREEIDRIYNGMMAEAYDESLRDSDRWQDGITRGLQDVASEAGNWANQTENLLKNAFKGAEDALVNFVTTGKFNFRDLANSIISDIARIAIQQSITKPLADGLGGLFGDIFGSIFKPSAPAAPPVSPGGYSIAHEGGVIGKTTGTKRALPSVFAGADRYHDGGGIRNRGSLPGLSPKEVPIIALEDERVLTEAQQANTAATIMGLVSALKSSLGAAGGRNVGGGLRDINVYNNASGTKATAQQQQNGDGSFDIDVMIEEIEGHMSSNLSRGEGMAGAFESRYGLSVATGN